METFFNGKKGTTVERRKHHMGTFFHTQKLPIMTIIDKVTEDQSFFDKVGQSAQLNMILHGPPGSDDSFELSDLLEILQGHVPRPGQIIIATTNHFERIRKICPAMFRPDRLTPFEIGYMTRANVNELIAIYFGADVRLLTLSRTFNRPRL